MEQTHTEIGSTIRVKADFETTLNRTINALKSQGFGVLTEIDVKETLKKKLDVDFRPYKILGACNPSFAHRALTIAPEVGLLLPCNVTIAYVENAVTDVSLVNPASLMGFANHPDLMPLAEEVHDRLQRVAALLAAQR